MADGLHHMARPSALINPAVWYLHRTTSCAGTVLSLSVGCRNLFITDPWTGRCVRSGRAGVPSTQPSSQHYHTSSAVERSLALQRIDFTTQCERRGAPSGHAFQLALRLCSARCRAAGGAQLSVWWLPTPIVSLACRTRPRRRCSATHAESTALFWSRRCPDGSDNGNRWRLGKSGAFKCNRMLKRIESNANEAGFHHAMYRRCGNV